MSEEGKQPREKTMVRVAGDVYQAMKRLAEKHDRALTGEIRQACLAWLERHGEPLEGPPALEE